MFAFVYPPLRFILARPLLSAQPNFDLNKPPTLSGVFVMTIFCERALYPRALVLPLLAAFALSFYGRDAAAQEISTAFNGGAVPSGTVSHVKDGDKHVLTLSESFSIHDEPPDPHWRVVDSSGNVFLLDKLKVQGDKINRSIVVPTYIHDVAKVQMWCAFVEAVLGEVQFSKPIALK